MRGKSRRQFMQWFALGVLGTAATACNSSNNQVAPSRRSIRIGSKDFTEQFIIAEMYAQALENAGLPVERFLNLGATPVAQAGLLSGEIDLYPEYTGTALLTVLEQPAESDPQTVYDTVSEAYRTQFDLVWLQPAPMNNSQALAMTSERSEELGIRTISDLAAQADQLVMIGPPEFEMREDGLPGLQQAYAPFPLKQYRAVDPALRYTKLVNAEGDVVVAFGTDGEISALGLVVLEDDRNLFPPYQVAPVVRQDALELYPQIETILNAIAPQLTDAIMRSLNYEVSGRQREPDDVAREFLQEAGLIS